jgi:pimeloyl-ACP methyl ester carboxylesterase/DNA-binding SARP family transcriptional activator
VSIQLLGDFRVTVDGRVLEASAFGRRDAALLVKLLALTPRRSLHREQVVDALWPEVPPAAAANRLHKAAHYARRAVDRPATVVLDGGIVALFPAEDVAVDVAAFDADASRALQTGDLDAAGNAVDHYSGELLPADPYESWAFTVRQRLALRYREVLRLLGRFDEIVALDPTDEDAHVGIMRRMLDRGDVAGVDRQFELLTRVLGDELGLGPSAEAIAVHEAAGRAAATRAPSGVTRYAALATQSLGRCVTRDGVRLAYATSGTGPPLVKASNWLSHLDYDWHSPVWRHWWQALSRQHTLVRYDERGCGLSEWEVDAASFSLEAWVEDLETVVDSLGLERFPLLGLSQGGPIAITYAARHPERVSHVIVFGTCGRSTWEHSSPERRQELLALGNLIQVSWGSDEPGFRQVYDARFLPDGPLETWRAFDELQRRSSSPRNAYRLWRAFGSLDCDAAARQLGVPTLILHSRHDQVWPLEEAEALHASVRGSKLVTLDSRNHILQADEPAFGVFIDEVERFLSH